MRGAVAIRSALPRSAAIRRPTAALTTSAHIGDNACRDILKNEEFPTDPKVLRDGLRVHGGLTDIMCHSHREETWGVP